MHTVDWLAKRDLLTPDKVAIVDAATGARTTYRELARRAERLAGALAGECGIGPGDRVAILAHNDPAHFDLLFALGKLGAILAPLNWRLTVPELAPLLRDCTPRVLVYGPEFAETAAQLRDDAAGAVEHCIALAPAGPSCADPSYAKPPLLR